MSESADLLNLYLDDILNRANWTVFRRFLLRTTGITIRLGYPGSSSRQGQSGACGI